MLPLVSSMATTVIGCTSLLKIVKRLKFAVVVYLEVFLLEVGDQATGAVRHRGVDRHRAGRAAKRRALWRILPR